MHLYINCIGKFLQSSDDQREDTVLDRLSQSASFLPGNKVMAFPFEQQQLKKKKKKEGKAHKIHLIIPRLLINSSKTSSNLSVVDKK